MGWYQDLVEKQAELEAAQEKAEKALAILEGEEILPGEEEELVTTKPPRIVDYKQDPGVRPDLIDTLWMEGLRFYYPQLVAQAFGESYNVREAGLEMAKVKADDQNSMEFITVMGQFGAERGWVPFKTQDIETNAEFSPWYRILWSFYLKNYTKIRCTPEALIWPKGDLPVSDPNVCEQFIPGSVTPQGQITASKWVKVPAPLPSAFFLMLFKDLRIRVINNDLPTSYPGRKADVLAGPVIHPGDQEKFKTPQDFPKTPGVPASVGIGPMERAAIEVLRPLFPAAAECAVLRSCRDDLRREELKDNPNVREFFYVAAHLAAEAKLDPKPPLFGKVQPWENSIGLKDLTPEAWDDYETKVKDWMAHVGGIMPANFDELWRQAKARALGEAPPPDSYGRTEVGGDNTLFLAFLLWQWSKS